MARRLAGITLRLFPILLYVASTAGCGGDAASNVSVPKAQPSPGPAVNGTVSLPNGTLAMRERSVLRRFAALVVEEAEALVATNVKPVPRNVPVLLTLQYPNGSSQTYDTFYTNDQGGYLLNLPAGTSEDTCRFIVSVGSGSTLTRAFVFSTVKPVNIDYISETAVTLILDQVQQGADLCEFSVREIEQLVNMIRDLPGIVTGPDIFQTNRNALVAASSNPDIQAFVRAAGGVATPVPTITPLPPTETPTEGTPSVTPTVTVTKTRVPTNTPVNTATFTATRTNTPIPTQTPTRSLTPTGTKPPPTATVTNTATPTRTNTATPIPTTTATPTRTNTVTPPPTSTQSPTPTGTLAPTATSTATLTPTQGGPVPHITIGDASGPAGSQVVVPISLEKNGVTAASIAPLIIDIDTGVLTFVSCAKTAAVTSGQTVATSMPTPGQITIVLAGLDLTVLPDGEIIDCTFTINAAATGSTAVTFESAAVGDDQFNSFDATGTSGTVTVGVVNPPTATPTPTQGGAVPDITIGDASGPAGSQVVVPISLEKNGVRAASIAPLVLNIDTGVLTFVSCAKTAAVTSGQTVATSMPMPGQITIVLAGLDLTVLPDGNIIDCTFTINAAATGSTAVTFESAAVGDDQFNSFDASGTSGTVTVGTGGA